MTYTYNAMGALLSLSGATTYVSQIHYQPSGQVKDELLGNGLLQQPCYDTNTLRLTNLRVYSGTSVACGTNPASPRLNLAYTYQNNGNVNQINDTTRSETLTYTYDELDRLLTATGPYSKSYAYNVIGNITSGGTTAIPSAVATSDYHTCALTTGGAVKCWGENSNGQLGNNSIAQSNIPVAVSGLSSGVVAITAGGYHTCALLSTGGVKCWGRNTQGQLGDGTTVEKHTPVSVSGLTSGVAMISAGNLHTCAVTTADGIKCWGSNSDGQLSGGGASSTTPLTVSFPSATQYTCAGRRCRGDHTRRRRRNL